MTIENVSKHGAAGVLTREQIGRLECAAERTGEADPLAEHILAGRIHKGDLFKGTTPITPLEVERERI